MKISVLSIFPESFSCFQSGPVVRRAVLKQAVELEIVDVKEHAQGSFRKIDDSPYGGGPGMVMRVDTLKRALDHTVSTGSHVVLLSPRGRRFDQAKAHEYSKLEHLVLVCGHYEGVDQRLERYIDEEISIGDYILTGGELASQVICDSVIRLLPGVIRDASTEDESFESGLLEYPQYTHPLEFDGQTVPEVLLSGNAARIKAWRLKEAIVSTAKFRPDLFEMTHGKSIGESGHGLLCFGPYVLKTMKDNAKAEREEHAVRHIQGRLPAPELLEVIRSDGKCFLLMSRVKGKMLCDPLVLNNRNRLMKAGAAALKMLWELDVKECPTSCNLDELLKQAEENVKDGISAFDVPGFGSPQSLLKWLEKNRPVEDPVVSHGNLRLSNIICDNKGIAAFLDFSSFGAGDRYRDIAVLLRSLNDNLCGRYAQKNLERLDTDAFFRFLGIEPDMEKVRYHTLLDELLR